MLKFIMTRFYFLLALGILMSESISAGTLPDYNTNPEQHVQTLLKHYGKDKTNTVLIVEINKQLMHHYENSKLLKSYRISTSKYGIGSRAGTNKTPLGVHYVKLKFGDGAQAGTIFKARRNTGQIADIIKDERDAKADYVTSRILWLKGLEKNINLGPGIDSFKRYIYIHGTAEEGKIGKPASHGCIRMFNKDVIKLYRLVNTGSLVNIIR